MNLADGIKLVKLARNSIFSEIKLNEFKQKSGVFVSIHTTEGELRGCIGFPQPIYPLSTAVVKAAKAAAFADPRFPQLKKEELDTVVFEISLLTKPELMKVNKPEEYIKKIKIGKDGLIAECQGFYGLLLPQVATDHKFNIEQFLNCVCQKAGLLEETWKQPSCKIYKFQAQIFCEETPNGKIRER